MSKIELLGKKFDRRLIKTRPGGGGKQLSYLSTATVIRRLNEVWGDQWRFEVKSHEVGSKEVVMLCRLTSPDGVVKEQFGSAAMRGDAGDAFKSAGSDGLKKCATMFGVGLELYGE